MPTLASASILRPCRRVLGVALLALVGLAPACKTTTDQDDEAGGHVDGEDLGGKPTPVSRESDELARIPPSLWSPGQRRSTAGYYFMVAEYVAMKERDAKRSLKLYEAAYGLDPNPYLGGKMLVAKAAGGDRGEALLESRKMVLLYPRDAQLRYFYGEMLGAAGQLDEAASQLEKCLELNPQLEPAYLELAEVYQNAKQPAKSLTVAKDFVKSMPSSIAAWSLLSRLYLSSSNYKDALVPARRAWEMQSNNPQLAQIYAIVLQLNGKTKQAIRIYEQLYRMDPTDDEMTQRMVELYRELGNLESAVELLDEMAKQGGQHRPAIQMQKAILLWELKRNDEAAKLLDQLVTDYPESDRVKYLAAFGAERIERLDRALELYTQVPEASSLKRDADMRTVLILQRQKKLDLAMEKGKAMLAAEGATWEAYGVVGGIYGDAERYEDAIRTFDAGFAKYPDRPRLLFLKGVYQEKAGARDDCIQTMRDVIEKDPENSSAYNYLGYLFAERGENLDEAEALISKALQLKPDDGFYLDSLGWVFYQKGDYDKALSLLKLASTKEPEEGVILEHVGDALLKKGDKAGAKKFYEMALTKKLEPKDKARMEQKLKDLAP